METRHRKMEVRERLLGIVVLMPWSRTEAVVLRRRGVVGLFEAYHGDSERTAHSIEEKASD